MQSVGQKLRAARLAQECTLEQVHSSTRISLKTLEAIEADDLNSVSSAFLYKSFVKQFAEFLGVDYGELSASIDTSRIPAPRMPGEAQRASLTASVPALRIGKNSRRVRWLKPIASFAIALVACSGFYGLWQKQKLHLPALLNDPATATVRLPTSRPSVVAQTAPAPTKSDRVVKTHHQDRSPANSSWEDRSDPEGFTLRLSATEPAWLSIVADGKVSFRGILERAETKVLEGHQRARIRTGNAGAVQAVFNGKPIGTLGSPGQVRTLVFTRDDYEVLDSSPQVSLLRLNEMVTFRRNASSIRETGAAF